jgi:hypothetical protein
MIRGLLVAATIVTAATCVELPASADPGGASGFNTDPNADASFYRLLTGHPEDPDNMTIWNFPLVKAQGLRACQLETSGMSGVSVRDAIAAEGYTWEDANNIASSADVAYCPWNLHHP